MCLFFRFRNTYGREVSSSRKHLSVFNVLKPAICTCMQTSCAKSSACIQGGKRIPGGNLRRYVCTIYASFQEKKCDYSGEVKDALTFKTSTGVRALGMPEHCMKQKQLVFTCTISKLPQTPVDSLASNSLQQFGCLFCKSPSEKRRKSA